MCGYSGFCNLNNDISDENNIAILKKITKALTHRGPDEEGFLYPSLFLDFFFLNIRNHQESSI